MWTELRCSPQMLTNPQSPNQNEHRDLWLVQLKPYQNSRSAGRPSLFLRLQKNTTSLSRTFPVMCRNQIVRQ